MIMKALFRHPMLVLVGTLSFCTNTFAADGQLKIPEFAGLADKAAESVIITLDPSLLRLAARFLDPSDPEDAAARAAIAGIKGIYVRSYKFDQDFAYPKADVDMVRKQLGAPGWQQLVQVRPLFPNEFRGYAVRGPKVRTASLLMSWILAAITKSR